jgi:predicted heme/steroid binding protein
LVKNKKYITLAVLTAALLFLAGMGAANATAAPATEVPFNPEPLLMTLEELKAFNGKNGQPAYIAVNGIIYDVTGISYWNGGVHKGFEAGNDLTADFKEKSPHDLSILEGVPQIGRVKVELTLEQLKEFNGKNGKPAYKAVDGIIYDMSGSMKWANGDHYGNEAGNDLTQAIKERSPHGLVNLQKVVKIGVLIP